jgi:F-type H+-transporting ATPase subunit epsilon
MLPESIQLEVVTPEGRIVTETVDEVVLPASEGSMGVLPGHAPLLSALDVGELMYRRGNERRYLAIAWGFVEVLRDRVSVLADAAERAEEIDTERAAQARDRASGRLAGHDPDTDFERAQIAHRKALFRVLVGSRGRQQRPG